MFPASSAPAGSLSTSPRGLDLTWFMCVRCSSSKCRITVFSAVATPPHLHPCINLILGPTGRSTLPIAHKDAGKISVLPSLHYYSLRLSCERKSGSPHVLRNHDQILFPLFLSALMWKRNKCPSSQGVILLPVSITHIPIRRPLCTL